MFVLLRSLSKSNMNHDPPKRAGRIARFEDLGLIGLGFRALLIGLKVQCL